MPILIKILLLWAQKEPSNKRTNSHILQSHNLHKEIGSMLGRSKNKHTKTTITTMNNSRWRRLHNKTLNKMLINGNSIAEDKLIKRILPLVSGKWTQMKLKIPTIGHAIRLPTPLLQGINIKANRNSLKCLQRNIWSKKLSKIVVRGKHSDIWSLGLYIYIKELLWFEDYN